MTKDSYENFSRAALLSGLTIYAAYESWSQVHKFLENIQYKLPPEVYPFVEYSTPTLVAAITFIGSFAICLELCKRNERKFHQRNSTLEEKLVIPPRIPHSKFISPRGI